MPSEIKVDTISEQTSANGVTIDGLTIKDGNIIGDVALAGTTPTFTIGDGGAEDAALIFDGNAVDYYMALDDSADNLIIGSGSTVGSNSLITIDSDGDFTLDATSDIILDSDAANWRFKDGGTSILEIGKPSGAVSFYSAVSDADILFKGNDGGAAITALTIDMSDAGTATFNHDISLSTDGAIIKFGADSEVTLTHVHNSGLQISHAGNGDTLTLLSTDDDASVGPRLLLQRDSSSPADNDLVGEIQFKAEDSSSNADAIFNMSATMVDVTGGTEDMQFTFNGIKGGSLTEYLKFKTENVVFNDNSNDIDFRVESNNNVFMLFVDGGNNTIGIGTATSGTSSHNFGGEHNLTLGGATTNSFSVMEIAGNDADNSAYVGAIEFVNKNNSDAASGTAEGIAAIATTVVTSDSNAHDDSGGNLVFFTKAEAGNMTEAMRVIEDGTVLIGKSAASFNVAGSHFAQTGGCTFTRADNSVIYVNRHNDDGNLIEVGQGGTIEGTISVSGTTVSYNGFTGSHWSRLADNSKPTILRGTIMDSIDEMCDWYQAVAEVPESTDDDGNVTPAYQVKESISLGGKSVGDSITFTSNTTTGDGKEHTGTIVKEGDVKHNKCKVSDTADSKKVYGVFSNWDDADDGLDGDVNDMNIAQVGTYIIRVNKDVTVESGDLLVSNGDGTAKVQDDDIIRSKTVAKVNSTVKIETYSDGSYTVPCTLHC